MYNVFLDLEICTNQNNAKYSTIIGDFNAKIDRKEENDNSDINIDNFGLGSRNNRGQF